MNSQASIEDQVRDLIEIANREGLYDAADWFKKWQLANRHSQSYRSLCGDFWNLAHEALGWLEDPQLASNSDAQVLAVQINQAIEDYDTLQEKERPLPRRVSPEASARALHLRQAMP